MPRRVLAAVVGIGMLAALLPGCSGGSSGLGGPPQLPTGAPVTYVSIDESSATELRDTWQQHFYRTALPTWTVAYDISEDQFIDPIGDGWQEAETELIDQVTSFRPSVVTVALGLSEVANGIGIQTFAPALRRLLGALHDDTVATVLVADVIPLPMSRGGRVVTAYNAAIVAATKAEGDVLVDVHSAVRRAQAAGDAAVLGDSLTSLGEELFATAFEEAMAHRPDSR